MTAPRNEPTIPAWWGWTCECGEMNEQGNPMCDACGEGIDRAVAKRPEPKPVPRLPHTPPWTLREVAEQALVLYEAEARDAERDDPEGQAANFWQGHAATVRDALEAERKKR